MKSNGARNGGIGMGGLLQVAFIILKLCGIIKWNWWWVLAPSWITFILLIIGAIISVYFAVKGY